MARRRYWPKDAGSGHRTPIPDPFMPNTPQLAPSPTDLARRRFLRTSSRFLGLGAGLSALSGTLLAAPAVVSSARPGAPAKPATG